MLTKSECCKPVHKVINELFMIFPHEMCQRPQMSQMVVSTYSSGVLCSESIVQIDKEALFTHLGCSDRSMNQLLHQNCRINTVIFTHENRNSW